MERYSKEDQETMENLAEFCKIIGESKGLSRNKIRKLTSKVHDIEFGRITKSDFDKSLEQLLSRKEDESDKTNHLTVRAKVDENSEEEGETKVAIRAKVDGEVSQGKKRRILDSDSDSDTESSLNKKRTLWKQVTLSYLLIPEDEEESCPPSSSDPVLNNKYILRKVDGEWERKKETASEEAMSRCEDEMYEADMLFETLKSALENAEKVIKGDMELKDVGVKFYRCVEVLYDQDMVEIFRENPRKTLPLISRRLQQKMDELNDAREIWRPRWKKVFEENSAKHSITSSR